MTRATWTSIGIVALLGLIVVGCIELRSDARYADPVIRPVGSAANNIEEVADRLAERELHFGGVQAAAEQPDMTSILAHRRAEPVVIPAGTPGYAATLRTNDPAAPVHARFWGLATAADASELARAAKRAGEAADDGYFAKDYGGTNLVSTSTVVEYRSFGWSGVSALETGRAGDNTQRRAELFPFAEFTVVAARGPILAALTWRINGVEPGAPDADWAGQGRFAVAGVLATIGGDPDKQAAAFADSPLGDLSAALPVPSHYGPGTAVSLTNAPDLTCSGAADPLQSRPSGFLGPEFIRPGVATVNRSLVGEVSVREIIAYAPDNTETEHKFGRLPAVERTRDGMLPCAPAGSGAVEVLLPAAERTFVHGAWHGELTAIGARLGGSEAAAPVSDSVAHVALVVNRGDVWVYLRWQGPAGDDLAGAINAGRATLLATLDGLSGGQR